MTTAYKYAQIKPAATTYTITYEANGGDGAQTSTTGSGSVTLPTCTFDAPSGKEFKAWQIGGQEYDEGETYNLTGNVTATALWVNVYDLTLAFGSGIEWDSVYGPYTDGPVSTAVGKDLGTETFTAVSGYYFPDDYVSNCTVETTAGSTIISITRVNSSTVTVSGKMPAAAMTITLPDATRSAVDVPLILPTTPEPVTEIDSGDTTTGANVTALVNQGKTLTVNATDGASATFDTSALRGIDNATTGDVTVTLQDVTADEPETAAAAVEALVSGADTASATPTDPTAATGTQTTVYSLGVSSGDQTVENYGGTVTVTLPAPADANPKRGAVYEKTDDGTLTKLTDAAYDPTAGTLTLTDDGDSATYVVTYKPLPFTDVKKTDYYYDAVDWAELTGVAKGMTGTTFAPNADTTRAQTVTFLWRAAGSPEPTTTTNPFTDVNEDQYYYKAVLWAAENGITLGDGEGRFDPDGVVSRAHLVTFLYRLIQMNGGGFTGEWAFPLDYADSLDVPDWAYEAFCYLTMQDIVKGSDGKLLPLDDCLRGQIMTILYRYFEETGN